MSCPHCQSNNISERTCFAKTDFGRSQPVVFAVCGDCGHSWEIQSELSRMSPRNLNNPCHGCVDPPYHRYAWCERIWGLCPNSGTRGDGDVA